MAEIIDGKKISAQIKEEVKVAVAELAKREIFVTLAVIQVGADPASSVYVGNKKKACEYVGFRSLSYELPEETTQEELLSLIEELNGRADVNGILVQLPLPEQISEENVIQTISPDKDVDGFHVQNVGRLNVGTKGFVSCTPAGIIELLKRTGISIEGKECVVVGRSNIVGKPMVTLLMQKSNPGNCTVTVCHSATPNIKDICRNADIIVAALGQPGFVTEDMVKPGATIIDVGTTRVADATRKSGWRLRGDVDFENVAKKCEFITPVPGGVGPMTICSLMINTLHARKDNPYK